MKYIKKFVEIGIEDIPIVGGKSAALGEMYQNLFELGIRVPDGFAITAQAYQYFMQNAGLESLIAELEAAKPTEVTSIAHWGQRVRTAILEASLPDDLWQELATAYKEFGEGAVAVRSSATAEDLPDASFAGQQETFLNVNCLEMLELRTKGCFASLFTDRAISYRTHRGFDHSEVALSICVQRMVNSHLGSSGVMFSLDTESGCEDVVLINSSYGLGENIVQGAVNPDEFIVFKPTLAQGKDAIIKRECGSKKLTMVYSEDGICNTDTPLAKQRQFSINNVDVGLLAKWAVQIEEYFSNKKGRKTPMDIEWAKDGLSGELFILQARPETVHSRTSGNEIKIYEMLEHPEPVLTGVSVGDGIVSGPLRLVPSVESLSLVQKGDIIVTDRTDPDWEPVMKLAAGIITSRGGRTCHAAIVSRELGIPAVVGAGKIPESFRQGEIYTLSCAEGSEGKIYQGKVPFKVDTIKVDTLPELPSTQMLMNLAIPSEALKKSRLPADGVGLARMEFIINNSVVIHPMALLDQDKVTDPSVKEQIHSLTEGYESGEEYFVEKIALGVGMIAAAFYPRQVIVRFSDFKSNEYAHLIGGKYFEPHEENPMIGFRGAVRYYSNQYRPAFELECKALSYVRNEMGLSNLSVMVPFCRTIDEAHKVLAILEENGLDRKKDKDLQVYVMAEVPSNFILADEFCELFDGFSIGSNDITQLALGCDRDSELLSHVFDERNPAVKKLILDLVKTAKKHGKKVGICGQAPSDYPEMAKWLVDIGIDSISLLPNRILPTRISLTT